MAYDDSDDWDDEDEDDEDKVELDDLDNIAAYEPDPEHEGHGWFTTKDGAKIYQEDTGGLGERVRARTPEASSTSSTSSSRFSGTLGKATRNNNPGNLRYAGQRGAEENEGFARFGTMEDGFRALERQVELDQGRNLTLRQLANKYAPKGDGDNDPEVWAQNVAKHAGVDPDANIANIDRPTLARAIAMQESSTRVDGEASGSSVPKPAAPPPATTPGALPLAQRQLSQTNGSTAQQTEQQSFSDTNQQQSSQSSGTTTNRSAVPDDVFQRQLTDLRAQAESEQKTIEDNAYSMAAQRANRAAMIEQRGRELELASSAAKQQQEERANRARAEAAKIAEQELPATWKQIGLPASILGTIGVALSGLGDRILGRENSALKTMQQAIGARRQELLDSRDKQLAHWQKELGSAEAASAAHEVKMWQGIDRQIDAAVVDEQSQEILANAAQLKQGVQGKMLEAVSKLERERYGTIVEQEQAASSLSQGQTSTAGTTNTTGTSSSTTDGATYQNPKAAGGGAAAVVKQMLAERDVKQLARSNLTQPEYDKQANELSEKGQKAREYRDAVLAAAEASGMRWDAETRSMVPVEGDEGDVPTAAGALASRISPFSSDDPKENLAQRKAAADRAWGALKRSDIMKMIREPSASLQDEFGEMTERPFFDADLKGQLEFLMSIADRAEIDMTSGYNSTVVEDYKRVAGREGEHKEEGGRKVKGPIQ
jgi:hypothetical protein